MKIVTLIQTAHTCINKRQKKFFAKVSREEKIIFSQDSRLLTIGIFFGSNPIRASEFRFNVM